MSVAGGEGPDEGIQVRGQLGVTLMDHASLIEALENSTVSEAELTAAINGVTALIVANGALISSLVQQLATANSAIAVLQGDVTGLQNSLNSVITAYNTHVTTVSIHCPQDPCP